MEHVASLCLLLLYYRTAALRRIAVLTVILHVMFAKFPGSLSLKNLNHFGRCDVR